ncbi:MAG: hypothetical protein JWP00_802 [Chloroflexi bacterium]|jgi:uncharacterized membrane protein|nr:hypothetical protein [Chloroflexota bacterium]
MAEIIKSIDISAPVEVVFDFVANPQNGLKFMPNFTKFQPIGPIERGMGAKVEAAGTMFGMQHRTILEIIEYVPNKRFVSRSTEGVKSTSTWQFKPLPGDTTEVTFTSDYTLPGSFFGRFLDKLVMEKEIDKNTVQTLVNLKKILEGRPNLRAVQ